MQRFPVSKLALLRLLLTCLVIQRAGAARLGTAQGNLDPGDDTAPIEPKLADGPRQCGTVSLTAIDKQLGCGQDGCVWKVKVGDGSAAILKVARTVPAAVTATRGECSTARRLQEAKVSRTLRCLGDCDLDGHAAVIMSPFVSNPKEFGIAAIDLGQQTRHAVELMLRTTWEMLSAGFINVDQANNIIYDAVTGEPLFIDFGRARWITKPLKGKEHMKAQMQVRTMLWDLVAVTVPNDLCSFAAERVQELQKELPPAEAIAGMVQAAVDLILARDCDRPLR